MWGDFLVLLKSTVSWAFSFFHQLEDGLMWGYISPMDALIGAADFLFSFFLRRVIWLLFLSSSLYTSWLRLAQLCRWLGGGAPGVSGLALRPCLENSSCILNGWPNSAPLLRLRAVDWVLCLHILSSVLRTAWLRERKQVDSAELEEALAHQLALGQKASAPFGEWCVRHQMSKISGSREWRNKVSAC